MSSLADIFRFSSQVPNWAPNERFLPNADYGRVGALKLADNIFTNKFVSYASANGPQATWRDAGRYHYYLLGKTQGMLRNETTRVQIDRTPNEGDFFFGQYSPDREVYGPIAFGKVLQEINEAARVYGFSPQVLASAVLTHLHGFILQNGFPAVIAAMPADCQEGAQLVRYNFPMLEALWGIRSSGWPKTMTYSRVAARKDYGGKGKRNGGKRRNGGRMKRRRF